MKSKHRLLKLKADRYDNMMKCVKCNIETQYVNIRSKDCVIAKLPKSKTIYVTINIKDMLEAGGYEFDDTTKYNVEY